MGSRVGEAKKEWETGVGEAASQCERDLVTSSFGTDRNDSWSEDTSYMAQRFVLLWSEVICYVE